MLASLRKELGGVLAMAKPGELLYRNAHYLSATVTVDPKRMRRWLPPGVSLAREARADLFCAYFPDNPFGMVYHEAGLFVHINVWGRPGVCCPWMVVDNDAALILGRELLGYPKKMGEFTWQFNDGGLHATCTRHGRILVQMNASLGEVVAEPPPFLGRPHRNLIGTVGVSMPRLLAFTPKEANVETRLVDMRLQYGGSSHDPLDDMGLGDVVVARLHRVDLASSWLPPFPVRPVSPLSMLRQFEVRML